MYPIIFEVSLIIKCFCRGVLVCSSPGRHCCSIIIWGMWSRKAAAGGGVRRQACASTAVVRRHAAGASLQAEKHKAESRTRGNNEVNKLSHWFCIPSMTYDTLYWIHGTNAYCVSQYSPRCISIIPTVLIRFFSHSLTSVLNKFVFQWEFIIMNEFSRVRK